MLKRFSPSNSIKFQLSSPFNSQEALEKAKQAVENDYAVVGVLEDLDTTFAVMEQYVPRFFKGVASIYRCMFMFNVNDFYYYYMDIGLIVVYLLFVHCYCSYPKQPY